MSVLDYRDEECCICGSYHTKFVCWKCYQEAAKPKKKGKEAEE